MALFPKWILNLFRKKKITHNQTSQQENTSSNSVISSNSADLLSHNREVRDVGWFTRKNHLVNEFGYTPTPVYNGPQDKEPMGWLDANGNIIENKEYAGKSQMLNYKDYIIKYFNETELLASKNAIDECIKWDQPVTGFLTIEQYEKLKADNKAGEQLLEDDVSLLKDKSIPNLEVEPNTTYVIGVDPYQEQLKKEQMKQMGEVQDKLKYKLGVPLDEPEEDDTRNVMTRAAEKNLEREPNINQIP